MLIQNSVIQEESMDLLGLLDNLEYVAESESNYPAIMVPIQYNSRLDKDLVHLEDFVRYADYNDIDDGGYALATVCEANGVSTGNIGFVVNEASIYADDDLYNTAKMLRENAYVVAIAPISEDSTYYRELEEALELDDEYGTFEESVNLLAYCEAFETIGNGVNKAKESISNVYNSAKEKMSSVGDSISNAASGVANRVKTNAKNVKNFFSGSINKLSNKLAAIRKAIGNNVAKLGRAAGSVKDGIKNRISKLKDAASSVWSKIVSLKNKAVDGVSNAASTVKNKVSGAWDTVKSKFA